MLELLYDALSQDIGIVIEVVSGDTEIARQALYKARREAGDPELSCLSLRISPLNPREIFIMRTKNGKET